MENRCECRSVRERGMALVLAILSLMLLTFLGLTLALTTSTELQIATNYRWSQQAQYHAEAGLEAGRVILAQVADMSTYWTGHLYAARTTPWNEGPTTNPPIPPTGTGRDYENAACDTRGHVGYGLVLTNSNGTVRYENQSSFAGQQLHGAFTVWIRRPLNVSLAGQYSEDATDNKNVVLVAEGVAPYIGGNTFIRAHQAVRVLETRFTLDIAEVGKPCGLGRGLGQEGLSSMGENFNPCAPVTAGAGGSLKTVFGGSGAGALVSTGAK
jgi:hypothetical protein